MSDPTPRYQELRIPSLARVEGETALHLRIHDGTVTEARLKIYEPPRFFEAFLRGRAHTEPPDLTSRICGICPVAYQMSACRAIEDACGIVVDGQLAALRRLLYCGEWIESQTLHIHMLHAPDFLGEDDVIGLSRSHPEHVERGLRLKQTGNAVVELLGGRAIHPVNVRIGGFHRAPTRAELRPLEERLRTALDDAWDTVRWVAELRIPGRRVHGRPARPRRDRHLRHRVRCPQRAPVRRDAPAVRLPPAGLQRPRGRAAGLPLHRTPLPAGRPTAPHRLPRPLGGQRPPAVPTGSGSRTGGRTG